MWHIFRREWSTKTIVYFGLFPYSGMCCCLGGSRTDVTSVDRHASPLPRSAEKRWIELLLLLSTTKFGCISILDCVASVQRGYFRTMITKRISEEEETDFVTAKKLCRGVFGFEPKFLPQGSTARRNLFASEEDPDDSAKIVCQLLAEVTEEMAERAAQEWNFDFMTETPIEGGRYKWEKVRGCDVPEWYTHTETTSGSTPMVPPPANHHRSSNAGENNVLVQVCTNNELGSRNVKCNTKPKLVQTSIKGWASRVHKKRRTSTRLRLKKLDDRARCGPSRLLAHYILRGPAKSS